MKALDKWPREGQPQNTSGWLYRVARNEILMGLRSETKRRELLDANWSLDKVADEHPPDVGLSADLNDSLLGMLFIACDPKIPHQSQIAFALKVLCGFSVREIAHHLFSSEENVYKRVQRARQSLAQSEFDPVQLGGKYCPDRAAAVRTVLYGLFSEGYLSTRSDAGIRTEICDEAIRLTQLLCDHTQAKDPETHALLALMLFHRARMDARRDEVEGLLLLEEQDRSQWDYQVIELGMAQLAKAAEGKAFTRFHAEAAIAAEHCLARSFAETRWDKIAHSYAQLEVIAPSPLHRLNRAVAVAEDKGPQFAIELLEGMNPPTWLTGSYLWAAVLSDLHRRNGGNDLAEGFRASALALAPNQAIRTTLNRRLSPRRSDAE
jgi:RNA polymerase sigma-70 factor (ECF subfamily)